MPRNDFGVALARAHLCEALARAGQFAGDDAGASAGAVKLFVPWSYFEFKLARLLAGVMQAFAQRLAREQDGTLLDQGLVGAPEFWNAMEVDMLAQVQPVIEQTAAAGVAAALKDELAGGADIRVDWNLANGGAREWARAHAAQLVKQVTDTTKEALRQKVATWIEEGRSTGELADEIAAMTDPDGNHLFNARRAQLIAQTEGTNAFASGNIAAWTARGYATPAVQPALHVGCRCRIQTARLFDGSKVIVWRTVVDTHVCTRPTQVPWGKVAGCAGMNKLIVSNGPYMGQTVQQAGGLYRPARAS